MNQAGWSNVEIAELDEPLRFGGDGGVREAFAHLTGMRRLGEMYGAVPETERTLRPKTFERCWLITHRKRQA
jgi:hypothetical protein